MKLKFVLVVVIAAMTGCASPELASESESPTALASGALTLDQCQQQLDTCYARNALFGLFTCPGQYAQCLVTASDGIPAQVQSAVSDASDCARRAVDCRRGIETPEDALECTTQEAECVADIVGAQLPPVVTGTAECVESAVDCIQGSETARDLAGCGDTLRDCAVDQAVTVLPPEVVDVVTSINQCRDDVRDCTRAAENAADVTECSQDQIQCVAGSFGVTLVQPPVAEAVHCAETGAQCALDARRASDVRECAAEFTQCNAQLVREQLTCQQKWTACLAKNPFAFFDCAADLAICTDN